ncbi:MAG: PA4780 family RIO1-like protein kinase [Candidatus Endonucleobacter bathymodioli]|uniref:non-specific serine/threonine protein kinase n=1 Tax=Candidatus Endonucleibacter bathymodioli TaxID=539814 RepID=A0AA90SRL1_9GAMM|nr:PA4780 family RIO1-like protein kinase [Candidatus Endonucleobacter bathymodioli]
MKPPKRLQPLIEDGLVDEVLSQLMSGKEATVYMVRCGNEIRCAKVYKEASQRSFKQAVTYQEGRKTKNSRRQRAMDKSSKFGRKQQENVWQDAEVGALYRLAEVGVRVPAPYGCFDGVLLMELVTDDQGQVAPRLNDISMSADKAREGHAEIMNFVKLMLCAGLIHGDLSEFNVLVGNLGPVIIDLPQAVNAAANNSAEAMLSRDVQNMNSYYGMFAPDLLETKYDKEMWALYERGKLTPDTKLTGQFLENQKEANVDSVLLEIKEAYKEEQQRLSRIQGLDKPE